MTPEEAWDCMGEAIDDHVEELKIELEAHRDTKEKLDAARAELRASREEVQAARKEIEDLHEIALDYSRERDEARARAADRDERQESYATCMVKYTDALAEIDELKHNLATVMELREIATGELKAEVARLEDRIADLAEYESKVEVAEEAEARVKALQAAMANRGDFLWMDLTPGPDLAVRILQAYRRQCDERMEATPPSPLIDMMNALQSQRAEILDHALAVLTEFEPKLKACEVRQAEAEARVVELEVMLAEASCSETALALRGKELEAQLAREAQHWCEEAGKAQRAEDRVKELEAQLAAARQQCVTTSEDGVVMPDCTKWRLAVEDEIDRRVKAEAQLALAVAVVEAVREFRRCEAVYVNADDDGGTASENCNAADDAVDIALAAYDAARGKETST